MILKDLASKSCSWLSSDTSSPFMSTRIRFARNISDLHFPAQATPSIQAKIRKTVFDGVDKIKKCGNCVKIELEELDITDRRLLMERHLASYDLVFTERVAGLIMGEEEMMSIMINEEDHLRIQFFGRGMEINKVLDSANFIEKEIGSVLDFAVHPDFGFLTACPTNAGTGLRISFLVHLPSLTISDHMGEVVDSLSRLGVVARGFYGEGTKPMGDFFQISNQVTLGVSETSIVEKLTAISKQIEDVSAKATEQLLKTRKMEMEDRIYRSYGTLQYARRISYEELMGCISDIRLGLFIGLAIPLTGRKLNDMLFLSQPAHIEERNGEKMSPGDRDVERAVFVREIMG